MVTFSSLPSSPFAFNPLVATSIEMVNTTTTVSWQFEPEIDYTVYCKLALTFCEVLSPPVNL